MPDEIEEPRPGNNAGAVPPQIFRGEPPRKKPHGKVKVNPWRRNLELGREFPGQWVLCSEISRVGIGCRQRTEMIASDKRRLKNWLERYHPLERWQVSVLTKEGTTCTKQMVARYLGTLTPEEDRLDRIERRKRFNAMMERRDEKARERELTARLQNKQRAAGQG
jgi:hypothetical protein